MAGEKAAADPRNTIGAAGQMQVEEAKGKIEDLQRITRDLHDKKE